MTTKTYVNLTQVIGSGPMISGLDSEPGGWTQIELKNLVHLTLKDLLKVIEGICIEEGSEFEK